MQTERARDEVWVFSLVRIRWHRPTSLDGIFLHDDALHKEPLAHGTADTGARDGSDATPTCLGDDDKNCKKNGAGNDKTNRWIVVDAPHISLCCSKRSKLRSSDGGSALLPRFGRAGNRMGRLSRSSSRAASSTIRRIVSNCRSSTTRTPLARRRSRRSTWPATCSGGASTRLRPARREST